ncbi:hypothetical protein DL93DRAFT_2101066 [Clavulina sp. PMI_390]|nr:hypothetical protein DL93DRAFT_2101066 [Clavulina sp. PMI_390]
MISAKLPSLAVGLSLAASAMATSIIYPLYSYPEDGCSAWSAILPSSSALDSITAYPQITFYFIVNPDSGPGTVAKDDSTYTGCIAKLRPSESTNTVLLGYVDTAYGSKSTSNVATEVSTYANWPTSYHMDGIFFDDVDATSKLQSYYSTITANVKTHSVLKYVTLNPGTTPLASYYTFADYIMSVETEYSDFKLSSLSISSSSPASKQFVILYAGPTETPAAMITSLAADGIEAIYLTDKPASNPYDTVMDNWGTFLSDVAATN